ncbi:iron-sulfur cluster biosynthesis family protein [Mesobacillus subterraneus]|uniref:Iron-sulfur cluster biosynthesis family protein n=1 Tax=Mesobacillus subterraneus TaxID=285983 RepID=A0A427TSE8_9BACI|nr:iron-sulfur cluster biosynthesis family protein [Mesobacillus subterraneus]RSD27335.1 iron-sulfur cluster biosynthesis family protein [Mesobacillus subterraneus]
MKLKITETATKKLQEKTAGKQGYIKLIYDIDGCGCAVNGVAALWLEKEYNDDENQMETGSIPIYIQKSREVFFDDQMTLDYKESAGCFQLKSPNEYLNPRMSFYDKTNL